MLNVAIICPDNALASGLTGIIDILNVTNIVAQRNLFSWQLVGIEQLQVRTSQGLIINCDLTLEELRKADVMLWVGSQFQGQHPLWQACQKLTKHSQHIHVIAHQAEYVIATCTSVSYLATSGFLDGVHVTSSWWLKSFYQRYFPGLKVSQEKVFLQQGKVLTSGAAQCYFSMMLYFVEQTCGEKIAEDVRSWLALPEAIESQQPYMRIGAFELHKDSKLLALQNYIKENLSADLTLPTLANRLSTSERTLIRRFQKQVGLSPSSYVRLARLERAKQLLRTTRLSVDEILWQVGYQDLSSLNKVFKAQYGKSLSDYRQAY